MKRFQSKDISQKSSIRCQLNDKKMAQGKNGQENKSCTFLQMIVDTMHVAQKNCCFKTVSASELEVLLSKADVQNRQKYDIRLRCLSVRRQTGPISTSTSFVLIQFNAYNIKWLVFTTFPLVQPYWTSMKMCFS